jgi:DNA invertase Pin-like site-specific DNA recombinase
MKPPAKTQRCAIYTRKSTEHGLEQEFNSLDAQREAAEAYIKSQAHEGWRPCPQRYDDGGFSGGTLERPALQSLLSDVAQGRIDIIVVYKVDRLTRSLADFAKLVELFDQHGVSFVSVTQQFNTTNSMGRLTLNGGCGRCRRQSFRSSATEFLCAMEVAPIPEDKLEG